MKARKRTTTLNPQDSADAMMMECSGAIFALLDFGKNYAANAISGMTAKESICALADKVRSAAMNFDSEEKNPKASKEVKRVLVALVDLEEFMHAAASDDAGGEPLELSKRGQARCIFAFAMDAAQALERAQIAIGAKPQAGFLENSYNPWEYV